MNRILTPFNDLNECKVIRVYTVQEIIDRYLKEYKVDVSRYFNGVNEIVLYQCPKSQIQFFVPNTVMGGSEFYEELQQNDWYYMDWKWEQSKTLGLLNQNQKILEIGSGKGNFVKKLMEENFNILGIELNKMEAEKCRKEHLNVRQVLIEELDPAVESFDVICSFQVFEHIPNLDSILKQSVRLLTPQGKLIFSVPNMDAFIKYNDAGALNFPPHHINWFVQEAFEYIGEKYGLSLTNVYYEPLQTYQYHVYLDYLCSKYFKGYLGKRVFYSSIGQKLMNFYIKLVANKVHSHTVLVEYTKG